MPRRKAKRIECRIIQGIRIKMIRWEQYEKLKNKYQELVLGWEK